jgi:hypothetical protein
LTTAARSAGSVKTFFEQHRGNGYVALPQIVMNNLEIPANLARIDPDCNSPVTASKAQIVVPAAA